MKKSNEDQLYITLSNLYLMHQRKNKPLVWQEAQCLYNLVCALFDDCDSLKAWWLGELDKLKGYSSFVDF